VRILLACPYAWDVAGGVRTHVRDLAATLAARGHAVAVVAPSRAACSEPGVHVVGRVVGVPWGGSIATLCPSPRSFRRIRHVMATFRPDVVHVHEPFVPSTGLLAALASDVPVVATFHAFTERSRIERATAPLLRVLGRRIAVPIACSPAAAQHAGHGGVRAPFVIVPHAVHLDRFRRVGTPPRASGDRVVLWVHRLERRKGFGVALEAFALLAADVPDVSFVVIGSGPERAAVDVLPAYVRARVHMLGSVSDADLPRHHAGADVFVAPATGKESFGIALVEAMAAGLPIVASDIRGYREVVRQGAEALLVPPGDAAALARALGRVLADPALATALATAGRARAARYAWDVVVPRLEDVYVSARRRNASQPMATSTASISTSSP
jgi:phosphatidylinositol alpha-mannosyltransferase